MAKRKNVKKRQGRPWPVWKLIITDILILGLSLVVFAYFHHVKPTKETAVGIVSQRVSSTVQEARSTQPPVITASPQPTATAVPVIETPESTAAAYVEATASATPEATEAPTPEPTPEPTPDPVGYFGTKFADKFTDGEVIQEGSNYQSANVNVSVTNTYETGAEIYIADIYVRDITCLQAAFSEDTFGRGYYEWPWDVAERKGAIVTINGDFYGTRDNGIVIRNGVLYRDDPKITRDVGVIYWDGTMECFSPKEFNAQREMERGAYQAWNFGPMLLDENGKATTEFNSRVRPANPRAAIGYIEPGHYVMVVVDGRNGHSIGLSLNNLSKLMERLGCKAAYNLDGGGTAIMLCGDKVISDPEDNGRQCSDFVVIMDEIVDEFPPVEEGGTKKK